MNIQFESDKINQRQAQGLILLLQSLFPALNNSQPVSPSVPSTPTTEVHGIAGVSVGTDPSQEVYYARINGVEAEVQPTPSEIASGVLSTPVQPGAGPSAMAIIGAGMDRAEVEAVGMALTSAAGPTLVQPEPTTRKRRTKTEIAAATGAADAEGAAAKQASTPTAGPTLQTAIKSTTEAQSTTKPIDAEALRELVNGYIAAHSMEAALELLQEFKCNRVNEAMALEPAKLSALVARLQTNPTPNTPTPTAVTVEPVTKDQLKVIVQGYLTRHTQEEAVAILRSFGCGLVSEAVALPAEKLTELVDKFRG
jgi:hypothetical protein